MNSSSAFVEATLTSTLRTRSLAPTALAVLGALGGVFGLFGGTFLGGVQVGGDHLAADEGDPAVVDTDGDGLSDDYEWVLLGNPDVADTDADGFSDLEEFARGSSIFVSASTPLPGDLSTRITARQGDGDVSVLLATYVADGDTSDLVLGMGLMLGGNLVQVPASQVAACGTLTTIGAADGSAVVLIEFPVRDTLFHGQGSITVFGTVTRASTSSVIAADVADVKSSAGTLFLRTHMKNRPSSRADLVQANNSGGSVYIPLPPPGTIPSTWNAGLICRQVSVVIGVSNGVVTREIISGECIEAFDSHCKSDCILSAGTLERSVDPLALIGG